MEPALDFLSEQYCCGCGTVFYLTDTVVRLDLVYAAVSFEGLSTYYIPDFNGDLLYPSRHFCDMCWGEVDEALQQHSADVPPVCDPGGLSIIECSICESGIRAWEVVGRLGIGELRRPRKCPSGVSPIKFVETRDELFICIACMRWINQDFQHAGDSERLWSDVTQNGECQEGTYMRCWRLGGCGGACSK